MMGKGLLHMRNIVMEPYNYIFPVDKWGVQYADSIQLTEKKKKKKTSMDAHVQLG